MSDLSAQIEIFSDIACPWCYIGRARFARALARLDRHDEITVIPRAYQLAPDSPVGAGRPELDALVASRGISPDHARGMFASAADAAEAAGLPIDFETTISANTFDAHRLVAMAGEHQTQVLDGLFRAHFVEGRVVDDRDVLADIAAESGMTGDIRARLNTDEAADEVRADLALAGAMGVTGVPFFVANRQAAVSGAQPEDVFAQLLHYALGDG
ncbi:DsbA family protein [Williamsia sp. CHRR-6]|uniref:DsbA family oxidoreductase n=1 Tax=Williamsia sp. CHRR-6 TaxID=2835871 RepID=UPI001BD9F3DF|nr:DsbA family oxidoreductase [Williamsia sp. CHRR-6]MBT0568535.1 DsbA family oxidoreductase [Williamsia sp. CHRR-6]